MLLLGERLLFLMVRAWMLQGAGESSAGHASQRQAELLTDDSDVISSVILPIST